jgi:DNA-binding transcriptional LysR family regulator
MDTAPVETSELLAFSKTVDAKSLSRAAVELGVPRATISRRLARLEERLGVRLLRRTTRSLALTDAGDAFYRHARMALDAVTRAEESVRRSGDAVRGTLRVSVPPFQDASFNAMLLDFAERYPDVELSVEFSTHHVDLRRMGYDVALRAGMDIEPGLVARTLAKAPVICAASPAYLAAHGAPKRPQDLRRHRCVVGFARGELPQTHWPLAGGGRIRVEGSFASNDMSVLRDATVRGLGIALLPLMLVGAEVARGDLVQVLAGQVEAESRVAVVYAEREFMPPQVRAFVDTVVAWSAKGFSQRLTPPAPRKRPRRSERKWSAP